MFEKICIKVKVITHTDQIDDIVNRSIRQTMTRSINTVLTVVVVVVAILILGAPTIFNFSLALLIDYYLVYSRQFSLLLWGMLKKRQFKKTKIIN